VSRAADIDPGNLAPGSSTCYAHGYPGVNFSSKELGGVRFCGVLRVGFVEEYGAL
jgi:hypothetical protein